MTNPWIKNEKDSVDLTSNLIIGNNYSSSGTYCSISGGYSSGVDHVTATPGNFSFVVGANNTVTGNNSMALGSGIVMTSDNSVQLGEGTNTADYTVQFGTYKLLVEPRTIRRKTFTIC